MHRRIVAIALSLIAAAWITIAGDLRTPAPSTTFVDAAALDRFPQRAELKNHVAVDTFLDAGSHRGLLVYRDATADAEMHDSESDLWFVREGGGTLVVGGRMVEPHTTAPGETRARAIDGGERHALHAGDVVDIPPRVPHQVLVDEGGKILYVVVKIRE